MSAVTGPCWIPDMPEEVYHADPCPEPSLSSTMAKRLLDGEAGPARLRQAILSQPEPKPCFDLGSAAHEQVLCRGRRPEYLDVPDWRRKESRQWRDEVHARGGIPLLAHQRAQVEAMVDAILAHPVAGDLFTTGSGHPEVSMFTLDPETGRWQRGRLDFLAGRDLIVDYKTTGRSAELRAWEKQSWELRYHQQAAQYLSQAVALDLVEPDAGFVHVVQETNPPYMVAVYRVGDDQLEDGIARTRKALDIWDRCLTLGDWPGIPATIRTTHLPAWAHITEGDDL